MMLLSSVSRVLLSKSARTQIWSEVTRLLVKPEYFLKGIFSINLLNSTTVFCPYY